MSLMQFIDDAEAAVDDLTFQRLKDEYFYNHLSDFRKEQLIKALVKTVEWWHERKDLLNDFGTFNSLSIGEFDVSVPRAFEDNPRAFWESMNVPTIAKRYLERAGLCYAGKIA